MLIKKLFFYKSEKLLYFLRYARYTEIIKNEIKLIKIAIC